MPCRKLAGATRALGPTTARAEMLVHAGEPPPLDAVGCRKTGLQMRSLETPPHISLSTSLATSGSRSDAGSRGMRNTFRRIWANTDAGPRHPSGGGPTRWCFFNSALQVPLNLNGLQSRSCLLRPTPSLTFTCPSSHRRNEKAPAVTGASW